MNGNNESTGNSVKFVPMPMSALMANLLPMKRENLVCSNNFVEDSDNSVGSTEKPRTEQNEKLSCISTPNVLNSKHTPVAIEEKLDIHGHNKENNISNTLSYRTYPNKDCCGNQNPFKSIINNYPSSEVKKRNVAIAYDGQTKAPVTTCTEPPTKAPLTTCKEPCSQYHRDSSSIKKVKVTMPAMKAGIRKFTPTSAKKSQRITPQKVTAELNRDSVRCLFPDKNVKEESNPQAPQPIPETPLSRKPPDSYAATPSYPQGMIGNYSKAQFKTTNIKGKKYMYLRKLGTGGSSEVYKVLELNTSSEFAVKCVNLAIDPELAQGYINEVRLLRALQKSDRVIKLYDYQYDHSSQMLRVVLEVGETDLSTYLKVRGAGQGLPPALVLHYWEEMLLAVHYIHAQGVIHADLKPANFLLVQGRLKLIDFGIASAISSDATSVVRSQAAGTYSYISPEALGGAAGDNGPAIKISFKSDVWSLGCILYSLVYGRTPFSHIPNLAKLAVILDPNHRIDYPPAERLPSSLISALKWCLTYSVHARPSVQQLLSLRHLHSPAPPPPPPLPPALLDKLRAHTTAQEFALLQQYLHRTPN